MQDNLALAKYVLPEELFRYFELIKIEQTAGSLHLYLDELPELPEGYNPTELESKGYHCETVLKDFPIREKATFLHVRRRRWLEKATGKTISRDWKSVAEGTHYTQSFASFLKELVGYIPD
jgi:hypothetical protein